jgi:hypothetical protein
MVLQYIRHWLLCDSAVDPRLRAAAATRVPARARDNCIVAVTCMALTSLKYAPMNVQKCATDISAGMARQHTVVLPSELSAAAAAACKCVYSSSSSNACST